MPSSNGLHQSRSFKLANPVFNRRLNSSDRAPPIHSIGTSSGESTGGSSEISSLDDSSSFVDEILGRRGFLTSKYKAGKGQVIKKHSKDEAHSSLSIESSSEVPAPSHSLSSISSLSDGGRTDADEDQDQDHDASSSSSVGGAIESSPILQEDTSPNRSKVGQSTSASGGKGGAITNNTSPYDTIRNAMETDPKWKADKNYGRLIGMYKLYGEIGAGNFAKVKLGIHQLLKEKVAIKIIDKSRVEPKMEKMLVREVNCMEFLHHPNIVRLYEVLESTGKLYLISEWAPGGDLYSKVTLRGRLSETEAKPIFRQILSAVTFMHNNGIIHRDFKAENIFFSTGTHCKVGDFGFATMSMKGQMLSTFCGSPPYAAPELFRDDHYDGGPVDIWALGILLYFMIEGVLPFIGTSIPSLKKAILEGRYELSPTVSSECASLIKGILQQKPFGRLTLSQIIRHPWLQQASLPSKSMGTLDTKAHSFDSSQALKTHELIHRQDTLQLLLPATKNRALSKTIPTREQVLYGLVSHQELRALEILEEIGITPNLIDAHRARGVRSHIVGIYRIILHKLQDGRGINTKQIFYSSALSAGSLLACVEAPIGLLVPSSGSASSSSSSSSRSSRIGAPNRVPGGFGGMRHTGSFRKQTALHEETNNVQQSTTCNIL